MDLDRTRALTELLTPTGWVDRTRSFARALRISRRGRTTGSLLLVGTPTDEPWHLTAHLDDEARWFDLPELAPTLVRWEPPDDAPPHLAIGLERLEHARRGETLMVVAPDDPTEPLLERVADARKIGATVFAIDAGDRDLESLAHESLLVPPHADTALVTPSSPAPAISFEVVTHLVSVAAADVDISSRPSLRDRLARMLDAVAGPEH